MNLRLHIILSLVLTLLAVTAYAGTVHLGTAANFGLLGGSGVTNIGSSVINGDVGSNGSTPAVTGFPSPGTVYGNLYLDANAVTLLAKTDLTTAYDAAANPLLARTGTNIDLGSYDAANPLGPGVYFFSSSALLTGNLTLKGNGDANDEWIFQIASTLTTATDSSVSVINATPCDVFWQVGSSATLGTNTVFAGNIMALTDIDLKGGILNGRALARNGAVRISTAETVNAGRCGPVAVPEWGSMALAMMSIPPVAVWFRRKK